MIRFAETCGSEETSTVMLSLRMQFAIASVSSLHNAPFRTTIPSPSAASTMARFVMDLLPGMTIFAFVSRAKACSWAGLKGTISMSSGNGMRGDR